MPFLNLRRNRQAEPDERRFAQGDWMSAPEWFSVKTKQHHWHRDAD